MLGPTCIEEFTEIQRNKRILKKVSMMKVLIQHNIQLKKKIKKVVTMMATGYIVGKDLGLT